MTSPRETLSSCAGQLLRDWLSLESVRSEEDTIVAAKKKNDERRSGAKRYKKNGTMHRPDQHHVCYRKMNQTRLGERQHPHGHPSQDAVLFPLVQSGGETVSWA